MAKGATYLLSREPAEIDTVGGIATVRLGAAPGGRVVLTRAHLAALQEGLSDIAARDDVTLVVLLGGRREFCLGADLAALRGEGREAAERDLRQGQVVMAALRGMPVPTIAAVGGLALGGGFELALACDLRWAHRRAAFALPEAGHGVVPAWGAGEALARELPGALAWELLAGERIGAARAHALGLVGRVFEGGDFESQAMDAARTLAALGRPALAGLKDLWVSARSGEATGRRERDICLGCLYPRRGQQPTRPVEAMQ